jgi:transposase
MKSYRPWSPAQSFLLPPSPLEWLPEGHLAYFVLEVAQALDLSEIEGAIQEKDGRGERPYPPAMMVALLVYGYSAGVFSSRRLWRATYEDVALRVIAGGEHPHFTTVNEFRRGHREALGKLFVQALRLCQKAGLVKLGHVAIDGTKMKANASKHKAMSYDRMNADEAKLKGEIEALLAKAESVDAEEDKVYGAGQEPSDLPAELQRRESRLAKIREVREALKKEAAAARAAELRHQAEELRAKSAEAATPAKNRAVFTTLAKKRDDEARKLSDDDDDPSATGAGQLPHHRPPTTTSGLPKPKAQFYRPRQPDHVPGWQLRSGLQRANRRR